MFRGQTDWLIGWLFWAWWPFETVFQYISGRLPETGRKKREMIDERKNVQTTTHTPPPFAPTGSAVGPCPTLIQISRTPRHWKFTQHRRTTQPPPEWLKQKYNSFNDRWFSRYLPLPTYTLLHRQSPEVMNRILFCTTRIRYSKVPWTRKGKFHCSRILWTIV